jgi:hypothetical protein
MGSSHIIRVIAIDKLLNYTEKEITIKIEPDTIGPNIKFLGPVGNQKIPLNSEMQVLAAIQDASSSIKSVEFLLDDELIGIVKKAPYQITFLAKSKLGRHYLKIKAKDAHGNITEKTLPIVIEREKLLTSLVPTIDKITRYRSSASIDIVFPNHEKIEYAIFNVIQNNKVIYTEKWMNVPRFKQLQLSHEMMKGLIEIFVSTKYKKDKEEIITPKKQLKL